MRELTVLLSAVDPKSFLRFCKGGLIDKHHNFVYCQLHALRLIV